MKTSSFLALSCVGFIASAPAMAADTAPASAAERAKAIADAQAQDAKRSV